MPVHCPDRERKDVQATAGTQVRGKNGWILREHLTKGHVSEGGLSEIAREE